MLSVNVLYVAEGEKKTLRCTLQCSQLLFPSFSWDARRLFLPAGFLARGGVSDVPIISSSVWGRSEFLSLSMLICNFPLEILMCGCKVRQEIWIP